jgi:hypothetical protein
VIALVENASMAVTEAGIQSEFSDLQNQNISAAILSSLQGDSKVTD